LGPQGSNMFGLKLTLMEATINVGGLSAQLDGSCSTKLMSLFADGSGKSAT